MAKAQILATSYIVQFRCVLFIPKKKKKNNASFLVATVRLLVGLPILLLRQAAIFSHQEKKKGSLSVTFPKSGFLTIHIQLQISSLLQHLMHYRVAGLATVLMASIQLFYPFHSKLQKHILLTKVNQSSNNHTRLIPTILTNTHIWAQTCCAPRFTQMYIQLLQSYLQLHIIGCVITLTHVHNADV